jgi:predicted  nucleic acid-binding Zn-ribbon protein
MPRPKPTTLSSLSIADLKALLAEKEIEVLKERQVALEADLRRVEKELARLVKGAGAAKPAAGKRTKRSSAKPVAKKARKKAGAKKTPSTGSIETVVLDLLKANGAPMTIPEILATIKKQKLVKTKAANFAGVLRQMLSKSSKVKRVGRGVYRA